MCHPHRAQRRGISIIFFRYVQSLSVFQKIEGANEGVNIADGHKDIKIVYTSATGIVDLKQEDATTESGTFDLQGRKVTHPVKGGIYISNGKKIIITK